MLDKNKTDYELGIKVHKELMNNGVETPLEISASLDTDSKKKVIEESVHNIMTSLGWIWMMIRFRILRKELPVCMWMKYFGGLIIIISLR